MSFFPISGSVETYFLRNGRVAANCWVKFYNAGIGSLTNLLVSENYLATDENGDELLLSKVALDGAGSPINRSSGNFIIHADSEYAYALYLSSDDADADNINNADHFVDNIRPGLIDYVAPTPTPLPTRLIGLIDDDATGLVMPVGFSVARVGGEATGAYLVTHNLNTTSYLVRPTIAEYDTALKEVNVSSIGVNTFRLDCRLASNAALADNKLSFEMILY